jgi:microcystin-dependent protein
MGKTIFSVIGQVLTAAVMNGLQSHDHRGEDRDGSCPKLGLADLDAELLAFVRGGVWQLGDLKPTAGSVTPAGWLLCDGSAVPAAGIFDALRQWIDTSASYLRVNGVYYLPDLRKRSVIGADGSTYLLGGVGGEEKHVLSAAELPDHSHKVTTRTVGNGDSEGTHSDVPEPGQPLYAGATGGVSVACGEGHNNMPPYFVGNWLIRAI